jgi:hypothetical protein
MSQNSTPEETESKTQCLRRIVAIPRITEEETLWLPAGLAKTLSGTNDPIGAVEQLLPKGNPTGFAKLRDMNRLDLTVEVFVLDKRWSEHFSSDVKQIADKRLSDAGYNEPEPKYLWNRHAKKRSPSG